MKISIASNLLSTSSPACSPQKMEVSPTNVNLTLNSSPPASLYPSLTVGSKPDDQIQIQTKAHLDPWPSRAAGLEKADSAGASLYPSLTVGSNPDDQIQTKAHLDPWPSRAAGLEKADSAGASLYPSLTVGSKPNDQIQTKAPQSPVSSTNAPKNNPRDKPVSFKSEYDQISETIKQSLDINEFQVPLKMELDLDNSIVKFLKRINSEDENQKAIKIEDDVCFLRVDERYVIIDGKGIVEYKIPPICIMSPMKKYDFLDYTLTGKKEKYEHTFEANIINILEDISGGNISSYEKMMLKSEKIIFLATLSHNTESFKSDNGKEKMIALVLLLITTFLIDDVLEGLEDDTEAKRFFDDITKVWRDEKDPNDFKTFLKSLNEKSHGFTVQEYLDYHKVEKNTAQFINLILSTVLANKGCIEKENNLASFINEENIRDCIWGKLAEKDIEKICEDVGLINTSKSIPIDIKQLLEELKQLKLTHRKVKEELASDIRNREFEVAFKENKDNYKKLHIKAIWHEVKDRMSKLGFEPRDFEFVLKEFEEEFNKGVRDEVRLKKEKKLTGMSLAEQQTLRAKTIGLIPVINMSAVLTGADKILDNQKIRGIKEKLDKLLKIAGIGIGNTNDLVSTGKEMNDYGGGINYSTTLDRNNLSKIESTSGIRALALELLDYKKTDDLTLNDVQYFTGASQLRHMLVAKNLSDSIMNDINATTLSEDEKSKLVELINAIKGWLFFGNQLWELMSMRYSFIYDARSIDNVLESMKPKSIKKKEPFIRKINVVDGVTIEIKGTKDIEQHVNQFNHIEIPRNSIEIINITENKKLNKMEIGKVTIYFSKSIKISKEQHAYYSKFKRPTFVLINNQKPNEQKSTGCMIGIKNFYRKFFKK